MYQRWSYFICQKITIENPLTENRSTKKNKKKKIKPDPKKRDYERVPLNQDINEYFNNEVKKYYPNSWIDRSKDKIGYEINFSKYFYKFTKLRDLEDITKEIKTLDKEIKLITDKIENEDRSVWNSTNS